MGYDLEYTLARHIRETSFFSGTLIKRYDDLGHQLEDRRLVDEEVIDNRVIIKANQPPEVLRRIIKDDIGKLLTPQSNK